MSFILLISFELLTDFKAIKEYILSNLYILDLISSNFILYSGTMTELFSNFFKL